MYLGLYEVVLIGIQSRQNLYLEEERLKYRQENYISLKRILQGVQTYTLTSLQALWKIK
jgi:hypothetical protein